MTFPRCCLVIPLLFIGLITGCTSSGLKGARIAFLENGEPQAAVQILEKEEGKGLSELLYHMEKGLLLHQAGRFEESILALRKAADLMKNQDYLSVSQQTASLLTNDWMTKYKGEYCERLWVHTYLMIDYLLLHHYEDALVEAKQALNVFDTYPEALSEAYFTLALIGFCYETLNEFNDAYLVYKRLSQMMPDPTPICDELWRTSRLSGIDDPIDCEIPPATSREKGELVLFIGMGNAPVKVPGNIILPPGIRFSFPRYENSTSTIGSVSIHSDGRSMNAKTVATNLERVVRMSLRERAKHVIIKETARVAVKETIVQQVKKNNDDFVVLMTRLAMMAVEEPDTRSWHTLPAGNAFLRIPLEPGRYRPTVNIQGGGINKSVDLPPVILKKGERLFFSIRANGNFIAVNGRNRMKITTH